MRGVGSYGGGNSGNVSTQMEYPSSSGMNMNMMNPIPEIESEGIGENGAVDDDNANDVDFITGLPWDDDTPLLSDPYLNDQVLSTC